MHLDELYSPLAVNVDFYAGIDSVVAVSLLAVCRSLLTALNMDVNVLAVAVVSTGSLSLSLWSIFFPSSALNSDLCVCGDFGVGGLLVPVG
jgi:hypothetical protein